MQKTIYRKRWCICQSRKRVNVDFLQIVEGEFTFITVEEVAADESI